MRMGRTSAWRSAAAAALLTGVLACAEEITTPGSCPDYCPADTLSLVDTVLTGAVVADTSIRGFNTISTLGYLLAGDQDSLRALSYVWFQPLPQQWVVSAETILVGTIDSIRLSFQLDGRDTAQDTTRILVYRAPVDLDTALLNFDTLAAYVGGGGVLLDSVPVDDSVASGSLTRLVPIPAFTPSAADSHRIAVVLDARASGPSTVTLSSTHTGLGPRLTYFVRGDSAMGQDTFRTALQVVPDYDIFARTPEPPAGTFTGIRVGDAPAARAMLYFTLPAYLADSVTIIRAQLELRLEQAASGRPGEQFLIRAIPVLRDFGGKSVIVPDTTTYGTGVFTAGDTGTVRLEIARPLRVWRGVPADSLPRVLQLRNRFEGASLGGIEAFGSAGGASAPRLRITYLRPFRFGVP